MKRRKRLSKRRSRRNFRKGTRTKKTNLRASPMRGGWRL